MINLSSVLEVATATHPGMVRSHNEDSLAADAGVGLAVLADGMGGYNAGEVASGIAVELIRTELKKAIASKNPEELNGKDAEQLITTYAARANTAIYQASQSQPQYSGMGTTIVAAVIEQRQLSFCGVGDSRLYLCAGDSFTQLTHDDSWVATVLAHEPGVDESTLAHHPMRHVLTNVVGARDVYLYVRGEYTAERRALESALEEARDALSAFRWHVVAGHGAYICGDETALLESLEGKRGMPRLKPPFPTESGFRGKPTVMHNVETSACVPAIVRRGSGWFRALGRTEPGTKLYCVSGHVVRPGVYELALGIGLDELVERAGGYDGTPLAFSPGGASSGFLPISRRELPLDFRNLAAAGSMLGSAGVVVLNDSVDLARAALWQMEFFERESCGQCAPCRIGTRYLRRQVERYLASGDTGALTHAADVGWEMDEGSICGLGMVAAKPLESARLYFPEAFGVREGT